MDIERHVDVHFSSRMEPLAFVGGPHLVKKSVIDIRTMLSICDLDIRFIGCLQDDFGMNRSHSTSVCASMTDEFPINPDCNCKVFAGHNVSNSS